MTNQTLTLKTYAVIISVALIITAIIIERISGDDALHVALLYGIAFLIGGFAKAKDGIIKTIENKSLNVEMLMIMAALGAFILGNYYEGAILILIFSISGVLESYASAKSEKALTSLLKLAPKKALRVNDGKETEVAVDDLNIGDHVMVKAGQQVPADGMVVSGTTSLDQSAITGEFVPVFKEKGHVVYGGSINIDGPIVVEIDKDPTESVVQKIILFVKQAQEDKSKSQTRIAKIERVYVYAVIVIALMFMIIPPLFDIWSWPDAFYRGIIVLVVGSPCALVASISPAMLSSLSNAARHRILIKGGSRLEGLGEIKTVVFDKTGTITTGKPHVVAIELSDDEDETWVKRVLLTLESRSNHPLAKAVADHLDGVTMIADADMSEMSGQGMQARINGVLWQVGRFGDRNQHAMSDRIALYAGQGHSIVSIYKDEAHVGFVALMDTLRDGIKDTIKHLRHKGIHTIMMTGDNQSTAAAIADKIGVDAYESDCFPDDKVRRIKALQQHHGKVMMIGDGINDAPALACADVSIAMGTGTDVSLETADIVFMNDRLEHVTKTFNIARRMRRIIMQNIVFSVSVITLLMISNVLALIQLPEGVIAHEMSTILVILNSLRLLFR